MPETYDPIQWVNNTFPALNASNLNRVEQGLEALDDRAARLELGVTAPVVVPYATSITLNATQGALFRCVASGDLTLDDIVGGSDGQTLVLQVQASGAERSLHFTGSTASIGIPVGQWWSGAFQYLSAPHDTWLLVAGSGGSAGDGGGNDLNVLAPQTLAYSGTVTPNAATGALFRVTAPGDLVLADPVNGIDGQAVVVEVLASGGQRTLTFANGTVSPIAIPPGTTLSVTLRYNAARSVWLISGSVGGSGGGSGVTSVNGQAGAVVLDADDLADGSSRVAMTTAERTKLTGVATGATANSTDAQLRNRATHTGTQPVSSLATTGTASVATFLRGDGAWAPPAGSSDVGTAARYSRGVNMAGGEFAHTADTLPGIYGTDYSYPSVQELTAIAARGHTIVRLPFRWERIQPTRGAALNTAELARLQTVVSAAQAVNLQVALDVHNYARYIDSSSNGGLERVLGTASLPVSSLVDLWTRLSAAFKDNPGVYAYGLMNEPHDLVAVAGGFAGTTRYDWSDGIQGWTGETTTASVVSGRLRLSATASNGFFQFRKDDAGLKRGGTLTGNVLEAVVTLGAGISGSWRALLQWQTAGFTWQNASSTTYTRVDTGATVGGLIAGVAVRVRASHPAITSPNAFAIQIEANDAVAGAVSADIDDFTQGTVTGGLTGAQVWESACQEVVDAIRAAGDDTKILVPGYGYSGAKPWATNHPTPWISAGGDLAYEAHYYFDVDNSGDYPDSYVTENAAAVAAGHASLAARAVSELDNFTGWLEDYHVKGFVGEIGWPNTGDTAGWNAVGEALYALCDAHEVDVTYWSAGARWGADYNLSIYTGTVQDTARPQASVVEAHPTAFLNLADQVADLDGRVTVLEAGGGGGGGTAAQAAPYVGPAFMVIDAETPAELTTAKTSGATHALVQVKWDQHQSTLNGPVDVTTVLERIGDAADAGLKVCLRVSPQYIPTFVDTAAVKFKRAGGTEHNPGNVSGYNVRDWVWSKSTRSLVEDFLGKLFDQLDWSKIERVQVGGGPAGELQYPLSDFASGPNVPYWWGYSTPAQSGGSDLAPRMAACPVPGHTVSTGTTWTDNDEKFVGWYTQSLNNWMIWLIEQHRRYFTGPIWVMHPGFGLRRSSMTPTGSNALQYRMQVASGLDWVAQIGAYPDSDCHPYSTWVDGTHPWDPAPYSEVNDGNAAAWLHLLRVARSLGRAGRIWGENTAINSGNDVMDRVFKEHAVAHGYEGVTWLSHDGLADGATDTYTNFAARIAEVTTAQIGHQPPASGSSGGSGGAVDSVNGLVGAVVLDADDFVDGTLNHVFTAADDTKLAGVADGATANSADAQLRNRATHTGTQPSSTISDFTEAVQDSAATLFTTGTHTGITFTYDDTNSRVNAAVSGGTDLGHAVIDPALSDPSGGIDATAAFAAAYATGRPVLVPPGTYTVTSLVPPTTSQTVGVGETSIIRYTGTGTMCTISGKQRVRFVDLKFLVTNTAGIAVTLDNTFNGSFTRCVWQGSHTTAGDGFSSTTGHIGVNIINNAGDNNFYDCAFLNLAVGIKTSAIQNGILGGKFGTNNRHIYATGGGGMAIQGHVDFVAAAGATPPTTIAIDIDGATGQWWLDQVWIEGVTTGIKVGTGTSGPSQFSMTNSKVAAVTTCVQIVACRNPTISGVQLAGDAGNSLTPDPVTVDATNAPEGVLWADSLVTGKAISPVGFPIGWTVHTRSGNTALFKPPNETQLSYGAKLRMARSDNSLIDVFQMTGGPRLLVGMPSNNAVEAWQLRDTSGATVLGVDAVPSTVNYVGLTGGATGTSPTLAARGADTNVDFRVTPKGTGSVVVTGTVRAPRFVTDPIALTASGGVITPNAANGSLFRHTATANVQLADPTGGVNGQAVVVEVLASGADRTVTFAGGAAGVTVPVGQKWTGELRLDSALGEWLLIDGGGSTLSDLTEAAQDAAAAMITGAAHTGISFTYDDTANTLAATVTGGAAQDGIYLDSFTGTDDARLTSAITAQQAQAGMPPIILGGRSHSFNQVRTLYPGLKLLGANYSGPKNLELSSQNYVTTKCILGTSITNGASSWWVTPGGNMYDIFMADFAVRPSSSGRTNVQFMDVTSGSLYACEFRSLAFDFMAGVFGNKTRKCLVTQVMFSGHWTCNNLWDTQFNLGGSDNSFWMGGMVNMGPSSSASQTGTYADNDYELLFDGLSNTNVGYVYMTALNGWRGLKVSGNSGGLNFYGGVYEGYKPLTDLLAGAAPGTVIRLEGGQGAFFGPNIGQAMNNPDAAEGGYVHMTGGEWSFHSPTFFRGLTAETVPMIYQTGGRLLVQGATRRSAETWTGRPRYSTTATGPNATQTSFYCPDQSMVTV